MVARIAAMSLLVLGIAANCVAQVETATLKARFVFGGEAPKLETIKPHLDTKWCTAEIPDERLIVNPDNLGIQNVALYLYTGRTRGILPAMQSKPKVIELSVKGCRYSPHVLIARTGDTVRVLNNSNVGHNANFQFFNNGAMGRIVPPNAPVEHPLRVSEPAPIPVQCNIHPWMKAHLIVLDHPFVAVSDSDGGLEIPGLPVGQKFTFRVWHESARLREVEVNGEKREWRSAKFERMLEAGLNDLGTIVLPASAFKLDD